jgi:hypothetical protein
MLGNAVPTIVVSSDASDIPIINAAVTIILARLVILAFLSCPFVYLIITKYSYSREF